MSAVKCPECDAVVKLAAPPAKGTRVKCPKCESVFGSEAVVAKAKDQQIAAVPKARTLPADDADDDERDDIDDDSEADSAKKSSMPMLLIVGGAVAFVLLIAVGVGGFFVYRSINKDTSPSDVADNSSSGASGSKDSSGGKSSAPPSDSLIGKWVSKSTEYQFERGNKMTITTHVGPNTQVDSATWKIVPKSESTIEFHISGQVAKQYADVFVSPAEMRIYQYGSNDLRDPTKLFAVIIDFRRDGRDGAIPESDKLGGTADDLAQRLAGTKWLYGAEPWDHCYEFTADRKFKRSFWTPMDYKVIDGRTVELTDAAGKHYFEIFTSRDAMVINDYKLDAKTSQRTNEHSRLHMKRAPNDYHRDDAPDDPKKAIVGRWEPMPDPFNVRLLPKVYEFRADGPFTGERDAPFPADTGKYTLENGNFVLTCGVRTDRYTVAFTQDRMGRVPVGADHWLARWNNQEDPLILRKLK